MPDPSLSPADTRLGALQRGLGRGFLQVARGGPGAREDLLCCILRDPRWDKQTDQRAATYAQLMILLSCKWDPLELRLRDYLKDPEFIDYLDRQLVLDVLAQAAWRGIETAAVILRRYLGEPPLLEQIRSAVYMTGGADLVARVLSPAQLGWFNFTPPEAQPEPPVDPQETTPKLLKRLENQAPRAEAALEERATLDELLSYRKRAGVQGYLKVMRLLGKRGCPDLLQEAIRALRRSDTQPARRRAYLVYLEHLPGSVTLDLAINWLSEPKLHRAAHMVLQRWAGPEHRERIEQAAMQALQTGDEPGLVLLAQALARLNHAKSMDFLAFASQNMTYSHGRTLIVKALKNHRVRGASLELLQEALWDCQPGTRAVACEAAVDPHRVRELASDRFEDEEVKQAAQRALLLGSPVSLN